MQHEQPLMRGSVAPVFRAEALFGTEIDLAHYAGKPVLLSFFRNAACALCNLQVHQLIQKYPEFHAQGLEIIGVFEAPRENMLQYVGKQDAPFALIPDPEGRLHQLYGVEVSESKVTATMQSEAGQQRVQEAAANGFQLTREEGSNFYRIPADFLIAPDGKIHTAFYADIVGVHLSFGEIEAALREWVTEPAK